MEHFHLSAYGTSTKPVVITMSTKAGVHIILVLKMPGNRNRVKIVTEFLFNMREY